MVGDLVQATALANAAVMELKTAALEADTKLSERLEEAAKFERRPRRECLNGAAVDREDRAHTRLQRDPQPLPDAPVQGSPSPGAADDRRAAKPARLGAAAAGHAPGIGGKAA